MTEIKDFPLSPPPKIPMPIDHDILMMDWINVNELLPSYSCKKKVKLENGAEITSYFHHDKMNWLSYYGVKTTHWQSEDGKFLHDVTHWLDKKKEVHS